MNIEVKARKFADGKVLNALNQAIEEAYSEGYRDGYKDRENEIPVDLQENRTEFVNLGLPSGTLWASTFETDENGNCIYVPFEQARKYQLPNREQFRELLDCCMWDRQDRNGIFDHYVVIGPNGNYIKFEARGYYMAENLSSWGSGYFWIIDEDKDGHDKAAAVFDSSSRTITSKFSGYKLHVHQVR